MDTPEIRINIRIFCIQICRVVSRETFYMKQSEKQGQKNKIGGYGEEIAVRYLKKHGFTIINQNYLKKWGEIDVVARGTVKIHFVEVKTVSYETKQHLQSAVTHGTWRPEENVHLWKIKKLSRAIESWLMECDYEGEWQIDVIAVRIVTREKYATVKYIPNIIIG